MKRNYSIWIAVTIFFYSVGAAAQAVIDPLLEKTLAAPASAFMLYPMLTPSEVEVVVSFEGVDGVTQSQIQLLKDVGITTGIAFRSLPIAGVLASSAQINLLRKTPGVRSIFANKELMYFNERSTELTGVDRLRSDPEMIADNGGTPVTGKGVTVLINDSGVDGTHEDIRFNDHLVQNVLGTLNLGSSLGILPPVYAENVPSTDANSGHGTHCTGIVGGTGVMSGGKYEGVAPGAHLVGYGSGVLITILDALGGLDYAMTNQEKYGIRVVSNSWGSTGSFDPADPINIATKILYDHGMTIVFAAGNEGPSANTLNPYSLAPWVISVAAGDVNRQLADFSSRGVKGDQRTFTMDGETWVLENRPTLTAPGVSIISTRALSPLPVLSTAEDLNELSPSELPYYTHMSGTSMAAPHVAGIVALVLEANPALSPSSVKDILESTSTPMPGYETWEAGSGYVNAFDAVSYAFAVRADGVAQTQSASTLAEETEALSQVGIVGAYPNPFTTTLTIEYALEEDAPVKLVLFDRFGNKVATLLNTFEQKGPHVLRLHKSDLNLHPGLYVAKIKTGDNSQMVRLMVAD